MLLKYTCINIYVWILKGNGLNYIIQFINTWGIFLKQKYNSMLQSRDLKAKFILEHWYRKQSYIIVGLAPPAKQTIFKHQSTLVSW